MFWTGPGELFSCGVPINNRWISAVLLADLTYCGVLQMVPARWRASWYNTRAPNFRHRVRCPVDMRFPLSLIVAFAVHAATAQGPVRWKLQRSVITFLSDAPMEQISAQNTRSTGLLDPEVRSFAVQVPLVAFEGFNAPLQREHFNENYMVSRTWPHASFAGRIIESVDLTIPGTHSVRAKGKLVIHGVEKERIIACKLVVSPEGIRVTSAFDVAVDEHDIRVPRVVQQKIASVVQVTVDALFMAAPIAP